MDGTNDHPCKQHRIMIDHDQLRPLFVLSLLLPALACGADTPASLEPEPDPMDASSGTDAVGTSTGENDSTGSAVTDTGDVPEPACGNEVVEDGEACDDGDRNGTPGHCAADCQGPATGCGDGIVQDGEACDDGNTVDGDGCNRDCRESGAVVWEHGLDRFSNAHGVDVGTDGAIYVAGELAGIFPAAWAARLDDADGTVEWTYELPTPAGSSADSAFETVTVLGDDEILWGGLHEDGGYLIELDADGGVSGAVPVPAMSSIHHVAVLPDDDYLITDGWTAFRIDDLLVEWQNDVGVDLAYRPGDDVAVAAIDTGAGFHRFTLDGFASARVAFMLPDELSAISTTVAWTSTADVVVAGWVSSSTAEEALVIRSSSDGELRWMYGPQQLAVQQRRTHCLAIDSQDAIIVGGSTWLLGEQRPLLMKLSSEGELLWIRSLELEATDGEVWACTTTPTDEIIAVGQANDRIWFAKLTP